MRKGGRGLCGGAGWGLISGLKPSEIFYDSFKCLFVDGHLPHIHQNNVLGINYTIMMFIKVKKQLHLTLVCLKQFYWLPAALDEEKNYPIRFMHFSLFLFESY